VAYIVWGVLSVGWSEDVALTVRRVLLFGILCLAALAIARRFSARDVVSWLLISSGFFLAAGFLSEIALGTFRHWLRITGSPEQSTQTVRVSIVRYFSSLRLQPHGFILRGDSCTG